MTREQDRAGRARGHALAAVARALVYLVFVPLSVLPSTCLELILDGFRRFLEHELREGFLVGKSRPFDPHSGEETCS